MLPRIPRVVLGVVATYVAGLPITHADDLVSIDEPTFVHRVLERSPRQLANRERRRAADAAAEVARVRPNPTFGYEREAVPSIDSADDFFRFGWTLDLRRGAAITAGAATARAEQAAISRDVFGLELEARAAHLEALHARAALAVLDRSRVRFAAVADTLRSRAKQGDASQYEADRATLELEMLDDERADAIRRLAVSRLRLGALLGEPRTPYDAGGELSLPARPAGAPLAPRRPDIEAARARAAQADRELALAKRVAFPRLELMAGVMRSTSTSGTGVGYVVGIGGDLPLFDRGARAAARSRAEAKRWRSEAEALTNDAIGDAEQARRELIARIEQATIYAAGPATRSADLERRAIVTYREGDRPILELLDVNRSARHAALRALELTYEARRAELALRRALGGAP